MDIFQRTLNFLKYIKNICSHDVVLIGTPEHRNIGDHAIALAEIQLLESLGIQYFEIPSEEFGKWKRKLTFAFSKNYTILYHGGGNLGSIWPEEEYIFRNILKCFSDNRIIVFPQTIFFDNATDDDKAFLKDSIRIYSEHTNLRIYVREQFSFDFMREYMPYVDVQLVPDAVMALNVCGYSFRREGLLLCMRNDREKTIPADDLEELILSLRDQFIMIKKTDMTADADFPLTERRIIVHRKLTEFASAELVITDRLHGMVFSAITETPCILLKSKSYKIQGCYRWLEELGYIRFVDNIQGLSEEIRKVRSIVPKYNKEYILKKMEPLLSDLAELK